MTGKCKVLTLNASWTEHWPKGFSGDIYVYIYLLFFL